MKRLFVILFTVVLLLVSCTDYAVTDLSSHNSSENVSKEDVSSKTTSSEPEAEILLEDGEYYNGFNAEFVETSTTVDLSKEIITIINSVNQLQEYCDKNREYYDFSEGFYASIEDFDDDFFNDNSLLLIAFEAGQSYINHAVNSIEQKDGKLTVDIVNIHEIPNLPNKEVQNQWHAIIRLDKMNMSTEKINVTNWSAVKGIWTKAQVVITEIQEDFFIGDDLTDDMFKIYASIGHDYCVGDKVLVTLEALYRYATHDPYKQWHFCKGLTVEPYDFKPDVATGKPVIYIYPTEKTDLTVKLDFNGRLGYTYPKYDGLWKVTAYPDGKLVDEEGRMYNTLFWDGWSDVRYDLSKGFCVKGEDTEAFLREKLTVLGLNKKETEEFLEYWLQWMEDNKYNIITFQDKQYKETAKLTISPEPDTIIRVFMAFTPSDEFVELEPQILVPAKRNGYTVVEWGGTMQ